MPAFRMEGGSEGHLRHVERAMHQRSVDLPFPEAGQAPAVVPFMLDDGGRAVAFGPAQLAPPDGEAVQEAARQGVETPLRYWKSVKS